MIDNEWTHTDIPLGRIKVITEPNPATGEIKQMTDIAGRITEDVIRTREQQVRNALIDLGWTPPTDDFEAPKPVFNMDRLLDAQTKASEIKAMNRKLSEMSRADLLVFAVDWCERAMEQLLENGGEK